MSEVWQCRVSSPACAMTGIYLSLREVSGSDSSKLGPSEHRSVHMAIDQSHIFVEFGDRKAAKRARTSIAGRSFDAKIVVVDYYPLEAFKSEDFTGDIMDPNDPVKEETEADAYVPDAAAEAADASIDKKGDEEGEGKDTIVANGDGDDDDDDFEVPEGTAAEEQPVKPGPVEDEDLD